MPGNAAAENVDSQEIAKFDQLAHRWWDPDGEFKPLHAINPLRLNYIDRHVAGLAGKRMLDIGCGGGILAESAAGLGANVVAIDLAEAPLAVARLHQMESGVNVDYRRIGAEALAADPDYAASFDLVSCLEMLEHVPDPASTIRACAALVKPGGQVFFSTINRNPKSFLFAIVGAEYILKLLPKGTHEYVKFIRPAELDQWSRSADLQLLDSIGMHYNPLTRRYWLAPGLSVNYLMQYRKPDRIDAASSVTGE